MEMLSSEALVTKITKHQAYYNWILICGLQLAT